MRHSTNCDLHYQGHSFAIALELAKGQRLLIVKYTVTQVFTVVIFQEDSSMHFGLLVPLFKNESLKGYKD